MYVCTLELMRVRSFVCLVTRPTNECLIHLRHGCYTKIEHNFSCDLATQDWIMRHFEDVKHVFRDCTEMVRGKAMCVKETCALL